MGSGLRILHASASARQVSDHAGTMRPCPTKTQSGVGRTTSPMGAHTSARVSLLCERCACGFSEVSALTAERWSAQLTMVAPSSKSIISTRTPCRSAPPPALASLMKHSSLNSRSVSSFASHAMERSRSSIGVIIRKAQPHTERRNCIGLVVAARHARIGAGSTHRSSSEPMATAYTWKHSLSTQHNVCTASDAVASPVWCGIPIWARKRNAARKRGC